MKNRPVVLLLTALLTLLFLSTGAMTWAQSSTAFDLRWHVIGSGGAHSSSADFRVSGTVGQNVTGPATASSADFNVTGGFWMDGPASGEPASDEVHLPYIMR